MKLFSLSTIAAIALSVTAGSALAEPLVIGAGKAGRGYDNLAQSLASTYKQRKVDATVVNLTGSDEITLGICDGSIDIAPSQQDAAFQRMVEGCELEELWTYPGTEFMFLMVPSGSDLDELEDFTAEHTIITDAAGSGSDFTLRQIRRIETSELGNNSGWAGVKIDNRTIRGALGPVSSGRAQAVFFVGSADSADLEFYTEQGWSMIEVFDKNLDELEFNGAPLYKGEKNRFSGHGRVYTYPVKTFVYGRQLTGDEQEIFENVMSTR